MKKPEYRVPTMDEIRNIPWNGFTVASTFSGAGGSSIGYRMAGFKVLYASEFVDAAADVYELNKAPYTVVDRRDIREVHGREILEMVGVDEIDLFDGSPPCDSFSTAGARERLWGKVKKYADREQRSDDLSFEFARILGELQPKTFVVENVSGLVKGTAKGYFKRILASFAAQGYRVKARLLDASWLGVPQARQRLIFVGIREDLSGDPVFPSPLPYQRTLGEAIQGFKMLRQRGVFKEPDRIARPNEPSPTVKASGIGGASSSNYEITVEPDNARFASVSNPLKCRKFSIAELKRLCSFPDDFRLSGAYQNQWTRLGMAVPPLMMRAVADTVYNEILLKQ